MLLTRYVEAGRDPVDLDEAIRLNEHVVDVPEMSEPEDRRLLAIVHSNLATCLLWRFGDENADEVLFRASRHARLAVTLADDPDVRAHSYTGYLATVLAADATFVDRDGDTPDFPALIGRTEALLRDCRSTETRDQLRYYLAVLHSRRVLRAPEVEPAAGIASLRASARTAIAAFTELVGRVPASVVRNRVLHNLAMAYVGAYDVGAEPASAAELRRLHEHLLEAAADPTVGRDEEAVLRSAAAAVAIVLADAFDDGRLLDNAAADLHAVLDRIAGMPLDMALAVAEDLGDIEVLRGRWDGAARAYATGFDLFGSHYSAQALPGTRTAVLGSKAHGLMAKTADALTRAGRAAASGGGPAAHIRRQRCDTLAAIVLEAGRARLLTDILRRERLVLPHEDGMHGALVREFHAAAEDVRRLERTVRGIDIPTPRSPFGAPAAGETRSAPAQGPFAAGVDTATRLAAARRRLHAAVSAVQHVVPQQLAAPPISLREELDRLDRTVTAIGEGCEVADEADVAASLPSPLTDVAQRMQTAVVYLMSTDHGGTAIVVLPQGITISCVLTDADAEALAQLITLADPSTHEGAALADHERIEQVVERLRVVIRPAWPLLDGAAQLAVIATGPFSRLPAAAAFVTEAATSSRGRRPQSVVSAPNAVALMVAAAQASPEGPLTAAGVFDPDLSLVESECRLVGGHIAMTSLRPVTAPPAVLERDLAAADLIHIATHATWDPADPLASAICVIDGGGLTLHALQGLSLRARLAVLSACDTARVGDELPDETIGFPSALMQVGVPGVIGTAWPVRTDAAFVVIARFMDEWMQAPAAPAALLLRAQRWMAIANASEVRRYLRDLVARGLVTSEDAEFALSEVELGWHEWLESWAGFVYVGV